MLTCCIIGLGYIGLPTAILIAKSGVKVFGIDINLELIEKIKKEILQQMNLSSKKFKRSNKKWFFHSSIKNIEADVYIICVPTPFEKKRKNQIPTPDLNYVFEAAKSISQVVKENNLVLLESTSLLEQLKNCYSYFSRIWN